MRTAHPSPAAAAILRGMSSPPLFIEHLSQKGRQHFEQRLQRRALKDNQLILHEGDPCRSLLFVEQGALRVFKSAAHGREITLYRVRRGELCILSMASLLAKTPYTASVAASGATVAWELEGDAFRALHASERPVQELVAGQLHRLLSEVMALVSEVAFRRVDARLAALILEETRLAPVLETTHERLAQHLGTAREVVSRLLENLRDDGVLAIERGALQVLDRGALEATASGAR